MENPQPNKMIPEKGDSPKKGPKFNIYWIYAIIAVILLSAQFMRFSPDLTKTSEREFFDNMLIQGDVERMDIVKNKERIRVYIKTESLSKDFYVKKFKKNLSTEKSKVNGVPLFEFEVTDIKSFFCVICPPCRSILIVDLN